jgi:hypothetical protein
MTNQISFDFSNNPDLAAIFAGKNSGDSCEVTISFTINEIDSKHATGSIKKVMKDYDEEKEAEPTPENPMEVEIKGPKMAMTV